MKKEIASRVDTIQPRVIATNNFGFLNKKKRFTENHFYISNQFSRRLAEKILLNSEEFHHRKGSNIPCQITTSTELLNYWNKYFSEPYGTLPALSHDRLEALHNVFDRTVSTLTTLKPLLLEIENEYTLVIKSLQNIVDEKSFLSNKIKAMMIHDPNPEALSQAKKCIEFWQTKWSDSLKANKSIHEESNEGDLRFVSWIGEIYTHELVLSRAKKDRFKELTYMGRWQFIKDWVAEKARDDPTMAQLSKKLDENPGHYRAIFSEDEVYAHHELDKLETKKIKTHITEQRRLLKNSMKDMELLQTREDNLRFLMTQIDDKIASLTDAIQQRFGYNSFGLDED